MSETLTTLDGLLKDKYRPKIVDLLNNDNPLIKRFEKDTEQYGADGRKIVYPAHLERNQGAGYIGEGDNLPSPGSMGWAQWNMNYFYGYGRLQLTEQTIKASKSNQGAFVRAMASAMDDCVKSLTRIRNINLFGFGVGILARVNGAHADSATTISLKHRGGIAGHADVAAVGGATLIPKNAYIAFVRNATPSSATDSNIIAVGKVSSVGATYATVVLSAAVGAALNDNDMVVLAPAGADIATKSSVNKVPMGLLGMVDDGTNVTTYHGISRSTYDQLKSSVITVNGDFDLDLLQRLHDAADEKAGGLFSHHIAHHSVKREYLKQMVAFRRYNDEAAMKSDGGFKQSGKTLTYAELPFESHRACPYSTIFGVDFKSAVRFVECEGEWSEENGAILKYVNGYDKWEAFFRVFEEFHIDRPDQCGRIDNIKATVDVLPVE